MEILATRTGVAWVGFRPPPDDWCARHGLEPAPAGSACPHLEAARIQLLQYFDKGSRRFSLELDLRGTDFQVAVWKGLLDIHYGETISYEAFADRLGDPAAIRAVAAANSRNPVSVVVPCHRVVGKDGSLTGYAGGLHRKEWLLRHEGAPGFGQTSLFRV